MKYVISFLFVLTSFNLSAHDLKGQVYKVIDGDTIDIIIEVLPKLKILQRVRIYGVNAPETRTRQLCQKKEGFEAKEFVESIFERDDIVVIEIPKGVSPKFAGRIIANIYIGNDRINLADLIIDTGHGIPYFGGKRDKIWKCKNES